MDDTVRLCGEDAREFWIHEGLKMTIDMLRNGMDSLKRGFTCYHEYSTIVKDKKQPLLDDYFILKQAVLSTHHGVEILLKYILDKKSEFLIVDEIDKTYMSAYKEKLQKNYQSVFQTSKANKIHTITYEEALNRVMSICDVDISNGLEKKLRDLNTVRNTLTHAEVVIEDSFIDRIFDGLLLELDVLFLKAIGNAYSNYYGFSEIKANYSSYMQYLIENKMLIKQKTFKALCIAQEKTEQYSGQNEVIYVEDITVVKKFMAALQEELDFGMDMYNRWCSGKTKVKVLDDRHISFWANDNRGEYIIKLKSMIVCVPKATSNESPIVIFESDKDTVEQDKQKYILENNPDYLEGLAFPTESGEPDIVYDPREIYEYQMHWTYDEDVVIPEHYQIVRFLEQRIFCCLNIQGLSYWDFNYFLRQSEKMTGSELADVLKEILAKQK